MSLLANLKTDDTIQDDKDTLGGGYRALDSDIYTGTIKYAYLQKSQSSKSLAINLSVDIDGVEFKETLRISNRNGENFYEKNGKKNYLPSFTTANSIALFACQKELADLDTEPKVLNLYSWEHQKEVPTEVPCITALHGKTVTLGIIKEIRPKQVKNSQGDYVDTDETKEVNTISKVFHPENHKTVAECKAKADKAQFYEVWLDKYKGYVNEIAPKTANKPSTNTSKSVASLFS